MSESVESGPSDLSGGSILTNPDGVGGEGEDFVFTLRPEGAPSATSIKNIVPPSWLRLLPPGDPPLTQTLPSAVDNGGRLLVVTNYAGGATPFTLAAAIGETIDGSDSVVVMAGQSLILISDGVSEWRIVGDHTPPMV